MLIVNAIDGCNPFKFFLPDFNLYFDILKCEFCNLTFGLFYRCCYLNIISLKNQNFGIHINFTAFFNFSLEIYNRAFKLSLYIIFQ